MLAKLLKELFGASRSEHPAATEVAERSAEEAYRSSPEKWYAHGQALEAAGDITGALECYRACAAAHPAHLDTRLALANALSTLWRVEECLEEFDDAMRFGRENPQVFSGYLLWRHLAAKCDPQALYELHREYGERLTAKMPPRYRGRYPGTPDPDRPLRIGYVSRNFLRHSVGFFIEPVIEHHDRNRYRVYCYHTHELCDETTERIKGLADEWRHVQPGVDDKTLADAINADAIDVLVDLGGHTKLNRLGVFAQQPAPVQMTWIGYPDTTGLATIDYRISDAVADPAPRADALHTERLLRLDPCFLAYRPPDDSPSVAAREGERVVFGSFNMLAKLNEPTVALWARILDRVPGSHLLLKSSLFKHPETRAQVLERFAAHGIASERIDIRNWADDRAQHLASYGEIDIALDPFPYNGTTTSCEALWMGVPVVTLAGEAHMSRVGASLLGTIGLSELVATSDDDYVGIAVALAQDPARRRALRSTMRRRMEASPLLDHAGFTRKLENEMRHAWQHWCEVRAPDVRESI